MRALVPLAVLAACAPSATALQRPVDRELSRRLGGEIAVGDPARVAALLAKPLDADAAVRVAFANSPRLQAALAELGVAGGAIATARGLGPLDIDVTYRSGGGEHELEVTAVQDLLGLVAGARRGAAHAELAAAQARATAIALRLAARVEIAFHDLVAAQQELELRQTAFDAADAAATLRERQFAAGNTSVLAQARERDAREQARIAVARAEADVEMRREALNALLGLTGEQTRWTAPGRLPEPPASPPALDALESAAVAASVDLSAARASADAAANHVADARLRTVVSGLGLGVSYDAIGDAHQLGPALRIGLPLLDWNSGERARANAEARRAAHELTAVAIELRAAARAARIGALAAFQEARHVKDVILPLRQQILDETLKHYNAMDADPFALVAARRDLVDAGHQYVEALRRYANAMTRVHALERGVALDAADDAL